MNEAAEIRKELKAIGITSRQVSVRSDSSVNISIKDLAISIEKVKEIAMKYESVSRCHMSGEILSGGNTFVFVDYSWKAEEAAKETEEYKKLLALAEAAVASIDGNSGVEIVPGFVLFKNYNDRLQASVKWSNQNGPWEFFNSARDVAMDLYRSQLQGKF